MFIYSYIQAFSLPEDHLDEFAHIYQGHFHLPCKTNRNANVMLRHAGKCDKGYQMNGFHCSD